MSHVEELNVALSALRLGGPHAAPIELCRVTARQMDAAEDAPTNRLSAVYLSCLKDLSRAATGTPNSAGKTTLSKLRSSHMA